MRDRPVLALGLGMAIVVAIAFALAWRARPHPRGETVAVVAVSRDRSAADVERELAVPIENALTSVSDLVEVRSESRAGNVVTTCTFKPGVDGSEAARRVRDAVQGTARSLPPGADPPVVQRISLDEPAVWAFGSVALFRDLETTSGVAAVERCGGSPKPHLWIDPESLTKYGVDLGDVVRAVQARDLAIHEIVHVPVRALSASGPEVRVGDVAVVELREDSACAYGTTETRKGAVARIRLQPGADRADALKTIRAKVGMQGGVLVDPATMLVFAFELDSQDEAQRAYRAQQLVDLSKSVGGAHDAMSIIQADGHGEVAVTIDPKGTQRTLGFIQSQLSAQTSFTYRGVVTSPQGRLPTLVVTLREDGRGFIGQRASKALGSVGHVAGVGKFLGNYDGLTSSQEQVVEIDRDAAKAAGVSPAEIAQTAQALFHAIDTGSITLSLRARGVQSLALLTVKHEPLARFVRVVLNSGPKSILRVDRARAVELRWEIESRSGLKGDVEAALKESGATFRLEP